MSSPHFPRQNRLLAALPEADYTRLAPDLELVTMPLGWAVRECDRRVGYVYFPTTSVVALHYVMESGAAAEIAIIGNEGMVGVALLMGGENTPSHMVVQSKGSGYRIKAGVLQNEFARGGELQRMALRFTQTLMAQIAQTAVCNRYHTLDQQLCRWLLLSLDRVSGNELEMTQELISNMLGVRREGVTETAGKLQADGLIRYSRGHITILDRAKLENRSCECYAAVKQEYDRLFARREPQRAPLSWIRS